LHSVSIRLIPTSTHIDKKEILISARAKYPTYSTIKNVKLLSMTSFYWSEYLTLVLLSKLTCTFFDQQWHCSGSVLVEVTKTQSYREDVPWAWDRTRVVHHACK